MRDEDVADAQKLARNKPPKIAKIEKQRAALENQIDVKAGIVEGVVDESGIEVARHNSSSLRVAAVRALSRRHPDRQAPRSPGARIGLEHASARRAAFRAASVRRHRP